MWFGEVDTNENIILINVRSNVEVKSYSAGRLVEMKSLFHYLLAV